jgi:hypothetical protein
MKGTTITSYEEFWPHYLREHSKPLTRNLHYVGTALSLICTSFGLVNRDALYVPLALLSGYGFAWMSHFFVQQNKPATFKYPLWSLVSDMRMFFMFISGRLTPELKKAGVP